MLFGGPVITTIPLLAVLILDELRQPRLPTASSSPRAFVPRYDRRQVDQAQVAAGPADQRADRRPAVPAHDQVALPVTDAGGLLDCGTAVDQHSGRDERGLAPVRLASVLTQRPAAESPPGEFPAQAAFPAVIDASLHQCC